jgi:hypothetical protein
MLAKKQIEKKLSLICEEISLTNEFMQNIDGHDFALVYLTSPNVCSHCDYSIG